MTTTKFTKTFFLFIFSCAVFFANFKIQAATITSNGSGNWNSASTWVGGVIPTAADVAIIVNGHSVTLTSNASITSLVLQNNGTSFVINSGVTLNASNQVYANPSSNNQSQSLVINGTLNCKELIAKNFNKYNYTFSLSGTGNFNISTFSQFITSKLGMIVNLGVKTTIGTTAEVNSFAAGSMSFNIEDSVRINHLLLTNSTLDLSHNSGILNMETFSYTSGTVSTTPTSTAKVYFDDMGSIPTGASITWPSIYSIGANTASGVITCNDFILLSDSFNLNGNDINIRGTSRFTGKLLTTGGETLRYTGQIAQSIDVPSALTVENISIENTAGGVSIGDDTIRISGELSFDAVGNTALTTNNKLVLLNPAGTMASMSNLHNHTISGDLICQFHTGTLTNLGWRQLAMPVQGITIADTKHDAATNPGGFLTWGFAGSNRPNAGGYVSPQFYDAGKVASSGGTFNNGYDSSTNIGNSIGHKTSSVYTYWTGVSSGSSFNYFTVQGAPNTGDIGISVVYDAVNSADNNYNWNMVGNPYPCAIDFRTAAPSGVDANAYVWEASNNAWAQEDIIPAFQAFMVRSVNNVTGNPDIELTESFKVSNKVAFKKRFAKNDHFSIKLKSEHTKFHGTNKIVLKNGTSNAFDKNEDAWLVPHPYPTPNLALMTDKNEAMLRYTTSNSTGHLIIPLNTTTYKAGMHTLEFSNVHSAEGCVVLEDTYSNTKTTITESMNAYRFNLSDSIGTSTNRFKLHIYKFANKVNSTHGTCYSSGDGKIKVDFNSTMGNGFVKLIQNGNIFDNKQTNGQTITFENLSAGKYEISIESQKLACPTQVKTVDIMEPSQMNADFSIGNDSLIFVANKPISFEAKNAEGVANFNWNFGDQNSGNGQLTHHTYASAGIYTIELTANNGNTDCDISSKKTIQITRETVGINELESKIKKVYTSNDNLIFEGIQKGTDYSIIDIQGKLCKKGKVEESEKVSISDLQEGTYIINLNEKGTISNFKIVLN